MKLVGVGDLGPAAHEFVAWLAKAGLRWWQTLPFGPVGHPRILGVIQAYWALCHELNAMLTDASQRVAPEAMLLGWLRDGTRETWVEVLSAMPYWPVAIDREGNWS